MGTRRRLPGQCVRNGFRRVRICEQHAHVHDGAAATRGHRMEFSACASELRCWQSRTSTVRRHGEDCHADRKLSVRRHRIRNRWAGGHGCSLPLLHVPQVSRQVRSRPSVLQRLTTSGGCAERSGPGDTSRPPGAADLSVLFAVPPSRRLVKACRSFWFPWAMSPKTPARARACTSSPGPWHPGTRSSTTCRNMKRIQPNSALTLLR